MASAKSPTPKSHTSPVQAGTSRADDRQMQGEVERFESVLKLRDTHPFGPKSTFARWLGEFAETGEDGVSPPPMA